MRDLVNHGNDLVLGTHGRSFWILDDSTPLRQITAQVEASLARLNGQFSDLLIDTDTDAAPTAVQQQGLRHLEQQLQQALAHGQSLRNNSRP